MSREFILDKKKSEDVKSMIGEYDTALCYSARPYSNGKEYLTIRRTPSKGTDAYLASDLKDILPSSILDGKGEYNLVSYMNEDDHGRFFYVAYILSSIPAQHIDYICRGNENERYNDRYFGGRPIHKEPKAVDDGLLPVVACSAMAETEVDALYILLKKL